MCGTAQLEGIICIKIGRFIGNGYVYSTNHLLDVHGSWEFVVKVKGFRAFDCHIIVILVMCYLFVVSFFKNLSK